MNVKDQRLMKLWDAVQNPAVDRGVTLVQVQGKSLMGALGITAVSADSGDGSINVEGDGDVGDSEVETHRRMTHYRGRESIRLHGTYCSVYVL